MHIKVHIFGIVDNLADIVKITLRACQGGVQLRKFGGVQLFQSCGKEVQLIHACGQHHITGQLNRSLLWASIPV